MSDFESAKSYRIAGCDHYDSPEECLVSWADDTEGRIRRGRVDPEELRRAGNVTVYAYSLAEREHLDLDSMSDDVMTNFEEAYADANLNLTNNIDRLKDPRAYDTCKRAIWTALAEFAETLPVTKLADKPVASRTYSADEVIAVLREVKPAWFK
jgi:hypothetical protein